MSATIRRKVTAGIAGLCIFVSGMGCAATSSSGGQGITPPPTTPNKLRVPQDKPYANDGAFIEEIRFERDMQNMSQRAATSDYRAAWHACAAERDDSLAQDDVNSSAVRHAFSACVETARGDYLWQIVASRRAGHNEARDIMDRFSTEHERQEQKDARKRSMTDVVGVEQFQQEAPGLCRKTIRDGLAGDRAVDAQWLSFCRDLLPQ